jgi:hypothetical protein
MNGPTSAKATFGALGSAVATIFWIIATTLWWKDVFSPEAIASLTGASAFVLGFVFSYLARERTPYLDFACGQREARDRERDLTEV